MNLPALTVDLKATIIPRAFLDNLVSLRWSVD